ncbi:hypothetical protein AGMMS49949_08170 [Alphaproteobacteria bacterium]|nr:hypothetical protein AGMMS49949_08170 [Alphaproteobacteria bacterium]
MNKFFQVIHHEGMGGVQRDSQFAAWVQDIQTRVQREPLEKFKAKVEKAIQDNAWLNEHLPKVTHQILDITAENIQTLASLANKSNNTWSKLVKQLCKDTPSLQGITEDSVVPHLVAYLPGFIQKRADHDRFFKVVHPDKTSHFEYTERGALEAFSKRLNSIHETCDGEDLYVKELKKNS